MWTVAALAACAAAAAAAAAGEALEPEYAAERDFSELAGLTENADTLFDRISLSIDAYHGQYRKLHQTPSIAPSIQTGVPGLAKTEGLCHDLVDTYDTLSGLFATFVEVKGKIESSCTTINAIVDACDQVVKVNAIASTAHPFLSPLQTLPYVGKVVKSMADTSKKVADGTKTAIKCQQYMRKLYLRQYAKFCKPLPARLESLKKRVARVFADVEIAKVSRTPCRKSFSPAAMHFAVSPQFHGFLHRSCGARASRK